MGDERIKKPILQCESQDRQCAHNVTLRRVLATIVAAEEQFLTYSQCLFVDLVIQHAMYMSHIVMCSVCGSALYFSTLCHKRHDFRKKLLNM